MPYVRNKTISVVVTKNPNSPGGVDFELNENNGNGPVQEIKFHNERHPGIVVYFNIKDSTPPTGLVFRPAPGDALWVAPPGDPCPKKPSVWDQFVPLSVENNGKQLIAYTRNLNQGVKYYFALRFLWPNGNGIDYDPIGNDQNGLRS